MQHVFILCMNRNVDKQGSVLQPSTVLRVDSLNASSTTILVGHPSLQQKGMNEYTSEHSLPSQAEEVACSLPPHFRS